MKIIDARRNPDHSAWRSWRVSVALAFADVVDIMLFDEERERGAA